MIAISQHVQLGELFEEATEFGTPRGIGDPSYLKLGYSFRDHDLALRMTWRYLWDATREQVDNRITRALDADNRNVTGSILERLFSNVFRTNGFGHSVYGLYAGDMKPPDHMGRSFAANHTHYLTTSSTTLDFLDVEMGIRHIAEHVYGSTMPARFLLLAHPNDVELSGITSWRAGVEYAAGKVPKFDFIPSANAPARITNERIEGAVPSSDYNGLDVTGSYDRWSCGKVVRMSGKRKKYTPEFREQAARLVIETGRPVAHVAAEIGVGEQVNRLGFVRTSF